MTSSDAEHECVLRRQLCAATEETASLQLRLAASREDAAFLQGVHRDAVRRCAELEEEAARRDRLEEGWERARGLHSLLASRRSFRRWVDAAKASKEADRLQKAASSLGDNLIKGRWMRKFAKAASLSQQLTALTRRVSYARLARAEAGAKQRFDQCSGRLKGLGERRGAEIAGQMACRGGEGGAAAFLQWKAGIRWAVQVHLLGFRV